MLRTEGSRNRADDFAEGGLVRDEELHDVAQIRDFDRGAEEVGLSARRAIPNVNGEAAAAQARRNLRADLPETDDSDAILGFAGHGGAFPGEPLQVSRHRGARGSFRKQQLNLRFLSQGGQELLQGLTPFIRLDEADNIFPHFFQRNGGGLAPPRALDEMEPDF